MSRRDLVACHLTFARLAAARGKGYAYFRAVGSSPSFVATLVL